MSVSMEGNYSFGSAMGDGNDSTADSLSDLLTYGAQSDDETTGQPNGAPNVKSDASAPIAPAAHVAAVTNQPAAQSPQAPTAPAAPDAAQLQKLNDQKAKDEVVSNVAPKWWERGLGALTAGAMAFGKVPGAVEAGQAVTNRGQNAAELQRQGRLKADDVAIKAWQDGQNQSQQNFENQNAAFNNNLRAENEKQLNDDRAAQEAQRQQAIAPGTEAPDDPKNPLGTWHATTVSGKPIALQGPPDKWSNSAVGKETVETQRRKDLVKQNNLTGDDAKYVMVNGKLKEPGAVTNVHVPSEGQQAYNDALSSWRSENPGKKPSLSDLRSIRAAADGKPDTGGAPKRGTAGQFSDLDKQTAAEYAKAQATYKVASESATDNNDRQQAAADLAAENARIGAEHSQRLRDLGGIPAEDSAPAPNSTPRQQPPSKYISPTFNGKLAPGMVKPGNIDLTDRPDVDNHDGTHSTVFSMGVNVDGKEMLIPGVGDGKTYPLRKLTRAEALDQYKKTGNNLGQFKDGKSSDAYAETLHEDQAGGGIQKAPRPNTPLTNPGVASAYLKAANGNKAQARAAAAKDGWKF